MAIHCENAETIWPTPFFLQASSEPTLYSTTYVVVCVDLCVTMQPIYYLIVAQTSSRSTAVLTHLDHIDVGPPIDPKSTRISLDP